METIRLIFRFLAAVLIAIAGRAVRRIIRGPIVPTWSWSVEMRVVAFRALIMASAENGDRTKRRSMEAKLDPSLPRNLKGLVAVRQGTVGSIQGEWHERRGGFTDRATILYLHGGAYVSGNPATHRRFVARLVWDTHTRAFVADYRIAPAHPFPAALDDALACYRGLLDAGVEASSILLAGDSAGGGLATALLLRLRDEDQPLPAGTILFSPYTDLEHSGASLFRNWETDYLPLSDAGPNTFYIGDADPRHPYISPMYGEFQDITPMLVFAGGKEMILDDSLRLVEAAERDNVEIELIIEPDMFHVWPAVVPNHPATARTLARSADFIMSHAAD